MLFRIVSFEDNINGYFLEMRPWQYYKQSVLLIPLIFSGAALDPFSWAEALLGAVSFSLVASSHYVFNDIVDREEDRKHPEKKDRPIASGQISLLEGYLLSGFLLVVGVAGSFLLGYLFLGVVAAYLAQNLLYDYFLKQIVFADALTISVGFVLRAISGAVAIGVWASPWLIFCTLLAALLLAFGKRRAELINVDEAEESRPSLESYSIEMLDDASNIVSSTLLMAYSLYTFFGADTLMMATLPMAYYCVFRYRLLLSKGEVGEKPQRVLLDRKMVSVGFLWLAATLFVIYVELPPSVLM